MADTEFIKNRAEVYLKENIYTCIYTSDGKFYHGYILELKENYIMLDDRVLGKFPILWKEITTLTKSEQLEKRFKR